MQPNAPKPTATLFQKIARATGGITLILVGIKILGFVEKQVLAYFFGTGYQVDAYLLGFGLMIVFWDFLRGLMAPSYLPTLIEYRAQVGEDQSWEFTSTVLNLMTLIFAGVTAAGLLLTPQLVSLAAPGFSGRQLQMAIGLTRLMLTGAGFFAVAIITGLTLNSYKRFILAVMDDVVFKISGFLGLVILIRYVGIYGLTWGIALGSWLAPVIHLIGLRRALPHYRLRINFKLAPLRKMFRLILPLLVGTACIESRRLIDNWFASTLRVGSVSALAFGYKLIEFAYVAVAEPLAVVVLPYFSTLALENHDRAALTDTVMTTVRTVIVLFTPLGVCLFMLRYPVVRLLFERGAFDAASTQMTVTALTFYAFGLISFATEIILTRVYFSLSDTTIPAISEVITITTHVGIILACINTMEHGGIALAFTLSKTLKALLLYGVLKFKLGDIRAARMGRFLLKIAAATGVMMAVMAGYNAWFGAQFDLTAFIPKALLIATSGSVGVLVFFAATIMLKVQEIHHVVQTIAHYIKTHRMTS